MLKFSAVKCSCNFSATKQIECSKPCQDLAVSVGRCHKPVEDEHMRTKGLKWAKRPINGPNAGEWKKKAR
jgi:hypothetical protein